MSNYSGGRRGPNVSQFLRELTIPGPETAAEDNFSFEDDLAMFTNTQFFDFETGQKTDYQAEPVKPETLETRRSSKAEVSASSAISDFSSMDFMSGDFSFGDFGSTYTSPTVPGFSESLSSLQPIQPNPQSIYGSHLPQPQGYAHSTPARAEQPKSDVSSPNRSLNFEDASRVAAEEDKRRRNTAASARFRVKKKQREQALEKSAKEMTDKVTSLEGRISQLETENRWLKNLIMEKNGGKEDIVKMWQDYSAKSQAEKDEKKKDSSKKSRDDKDSETKAEIEVEL